MTRVARWTLPSTRTRTGTRSSSSSSSATVPDSATLGAARPRFSDLTLSLRRLSEAQQRGEPAAEHPPQRPRLLLGHRQRRQRAKPLGPTVPGRFGWDLPGGGVTAIVDAPPEFRGPSVQVAGMYPFSAGGTLPMIGATLGPHQFGRGIVCADPVSWFGAQLITNPSAFVLGRPGVGKSSLVCRIVLQVVPKGIIPLLLSDIKGEYVNLIRDGLQGQVIAPGRGTEFINPLDVLGLEVGDMPGWLLT